MNISVVIPTRNRPESLHRLLRSLQDQTHPVFEVIVVDASDTTPAEISLRQRFPQLNVILLPSQPSVCFQRNSGIRHATSPYVFLCDDDIEVPPDYISTLAAYIVQHPEALAVTGLVLQKNEKGEWSSQFPPATFRQLLWKFIFQTSVWAEVSRVPTGRLPGLFLRGMKKFYQWRGNTFTLSGMPLITHFASPVVATAVYGLGASIIRRDWLLRHPYDERLDTYGIGDNYGVAIRLPANNPIRLVTAAHVYHYQESENRLPGELVYFRRILAWHYFMTRSERFNRFTRMVLYWSLFGNLVSQLILGQSTFAGATLKAMGLILSGKNPYIMAYRNNEPGPINPVL